MCNFSRHYLWKCLIENYRDIFGSCHWKKHDARFMIRDSSRTDFAKMFISDIVICIRIGIISVPASLVWSLLCWFWSEQCPWNFVKIAHPMSQFLISCAKRGSNVRWLFQQLKNGSAWSNCSGHSDPWKGKGQQHRLPTPFCRRDARRHRIVVVPQRPQRHYYYYYYSRKVSWEKCHIFIAFRIILVDRLRL